MRTLYEIVEAVKDGELPEYDEIRYALLATDFLLTDLDQFVLMSLYGKGKLDGWDKKRYEMKYEQRRKALNIDPKTYVGSFDPDAPGRQQERAMFKRIFDKVVAAQAGEGGQDE